MLPWLKNKRLRKKNDELESRVQQLVHQNNLLRDEKNELQSSVQSLVRQNNLLQDQLDERTTDMDVSSRKVSTLEHENTKLSRELVKQQEDTKKAGLLFMNAADKYEEEARKQLSENVDELVNTRKAGLVMMNTADAYEEAARNQIKEKEWELEDTRKAVLVLMDAADTYQEIADKQIKHMVEELKVMGAEKAEIDARVASLESRLKIALDKNKELEGHYDKVKFENKNLQLEAQRLMIELGVLVKAKDASTNLCNTETPEIMKELEDLETKEEQTQENEKLQLEAQELMMELGVLAEAEDASTNSCNTETPKNMKEPKDLETKDDETQANKDLVKGENVLWSGIFLRGPEGFPPN
ncbi:hypothetical protein BDA96_08G190500 [Sorghum bicolor]|uniref:Uncharacterized protein n=2 Tax=Sorghum bicolor TaxID=4558 RepID=A0A921QHN8_SORBI|nr:hypothetical protein SORBI_3008G172400 [Sorghum bicolor]KAG0521776.1 hypothetical protein BDA96_08G190500 [Sorghum bicolor]